MSVLSAFLFGLLQGVTEFLPVSSSGHLAVLKELTNLEEVPLLFDILLHLASLGAVLLVFRKKIGFLITSTWHFIIRKAGPQDRENLVYVMAIVVGTFVTGVMGLFIKKFFPDPSIKLVSVLFIVTAIVLCLGFIIGRYHEKRTASLASRSVRVRDGLVCGFAQGLGVFPGISRSGITISSALSVGVPRAVAGELSFLLSIPAILGAFILELKDADTLMAQVEFWPLLVGVLAAFVSGLLALKLLMTLVRKGTLAWFAIWLLPLGIIGLLYL